LIFTKVAALPDVTCITTLDHNIGDDFVREGILYLLERTLGSFSVSLVHKHIPVTVRPEWEFFYASGFSRILDRLPRARGEFWSRMIDMLPLSPATDKVLNSWLLVQCGAPVYWAGAHKNEWYQPLIRRRLCSMKQRATLLNLGAGACLAYNAAGSELAKCPSDSAYIRELHGLCAVTSVRDSLSLQILNRLGLDAPLIPCPSIFARDYWNISPREPEYIALNFMPIGGHYDFRQNIDSQRWTKIFQKFHADLSSRHPVLLVCHNNAEFRAAGRLFPGSRRFVGATSREYLECYSRARFFIGNRVHGAFAVAGFGRPGLVIGNDSRARMMNEIGLKSLFVSDVDYTLLQDSCKDLEAEVCRFPERFADMKNFAFMEYQRILDPLQSIFMRAEK
jgi:hypothetical protein